MEVRSVSSLRVASRVWQPGVGAWTLTVVCKATFDLHPMECALAAEQEAIHEQDVTWGGEPSGSVFAPADLVPGKERMDVVLVGQAYSAHGAPVRTLSARLMVGSHIDKTIEIHADRGRRSDGTLQEGRPFTCMPLLYERAAGGPDTWNPVGVPSGSAAVPNLVPPRTRVAAHGDPIAPTGFGPLSARWPTRWDRLRAHAASFSPEDWHASVLPPDLERGFFNVAPPDQQLPVFRENETIVLEHLHPEHPRLVTRLPGVRPVAFVARAGAAPHPLTLRADLLWIYTDGAICTLTWRGQVPLGQPGEAGLLLVGLAGPNETLAWADLHRLWTEQTRGEPPPVTLDPDDALVEPEPADISATIAPFMPPAAKPAMPFSDAAAQKGSSDTTSEWRAVSDHAVSPPAAQPPAAARLGSSAASWGSVPASAETTSFLSTEALMSHAGSPGDTTLAGAGAAHAPATPFVTSGAPVAPAAPAASVEPHRGPLPPPAPPPLASRRSGDSGIFAAPPLPAPVAPLPAPVAPPVTHSPWAAGAPVAAAPLPATVGMAMVAAASAAPVAAPVRAQEAAPAHAIEARPEAAEVVQLLWFNPDAVPRIRRRPPWRKLLQQLESRPPDPELDDPALARDPVDLEDRREVFEILARAASEDPRALDDLLAGAVRDGGLYVAPLALFAGDLVPVFDPVSRLRAMSSAAGPFADGDERLRPALDVTAQFLATPELLATPAALDVMTKHVRNAFLAKPHGVEQGHLDDEAERALLAARCYQMRKVFGAPHIRATLHLSNSAAHAVPAYVPEPLVTLLPMYPRLGVRVIAEVHPPVDHQDVHSASLRVLALARGLGKTGPGRGVWR